MRPAEKGIAQSVRQRLLNRARETGEDYNLLLNRYAIERLLYRLSQSQHANQFVLKGAMLFAVWTGALHRPTRDLDLLGFGEPSDERLIGIFREICNQAVVGITPHISTACQIGLIASPLDRLMTQTVTLFRAAL